MRNNYIQTQDKRYVRDPHSRALLAVDRRSAEEYKFKSNLVKRNKVLEDEMAALKEQLEEIKQLLAGK